MDLGDLLPAPYNPRRIEPDAFSGLTASLKRFGLVQPIVWNRRTRHVVGGHQRLDALRALGQARGQVAVVDLPLSEEKALNLTLNNPAIAGEFTTDVEAILAELKAALPVEEFRALRLDEIVAAPVEDEAEITEDEVPDPPKVAVTKAGDVWTLGKHRVVCGDAASPSDVAVAVDGKRPALLVTDPPYGVGYEGGRNPESNRSRDRLAGDEGTDVTSRFVATVLAALAPACAAYVWFAGVKGSATYNAIERAGLKVRSLIFWNKIEPHYGSFMAQYLQKHEPCLYAVRGAPRWRGPTNEVAVWDVKQPARNDLHPTQKPVEIMARPIRNHGVPEVLDPFLGSGTTLIAAEQLGRTCYGLEIEPKYCDVIVERWENLTGGKAKRGK
jgi:DNA modification methylase